MKKIYIVTGANGFLGNNVIRKLIKTDTGAEIRALVLEGDDPVSLRGLDCKIFYGDVTKKESLKDIFNVDKDDDVCVIHCASYVYIKAKKNPDVKRVNVGGIKNIVDEVLRINAKLVYVSSVHAIPELDGNKEMSEVVSFNPDSVHGIYAKTKAEASEYVLKAVREKGLNACIVQPSGIIGPYDFGKTHLTQMIIEFGNGRLKACVKGKYDFVDVRDVADGVIAAIEKGEKGECYVLSNKQVYIRDILDIVAEVMGKKKIKTMVPIWLAKLGAPICEAYYNLKKKTPLFTSYSLYTITSNSNFSHKKADEKLGYSNRDFYDTIKDTVEFLIEQGRIQKKAK